MRLLPISQWVYGLYRVTYHEREDLPAKLTRYNVSTCDSHLECEVKEEWPGEWAKWFKWELVEDKVSPPRVIGNVYGTPLYESGWAAGKREKEKRGLR